jgi:hypothetical protein
MSDFSAPPLAAGMTLKLILAWGFVGIPLAWGVVETCLNAMKLFQ